MVDVVVVIDAVYDFLNIDGIFAQHYGIDSCKPLLDLTPTLNKIVSTMEAKNKSIILVGSHYTYDQFEKGGTLSTLCTTEKGRGIILNTNKESIDLTLIKNTNYILDCINIEMKNKLFEIIKDKRVFVCGVTSSHCVPKSAAQLIQHCQKVIIAKNGTASRTKYTEQKRNEIFQSLHDKGAEIIDDWRELFIDEQTLCIASGYIHCNSDKTEFSLRLIKIIALYYIKSDPQDNTEKEL